MPAALAGLVLLGVPPGSLALRAQETPGPDEPAAAEPKVDSRTKGTLLERATRRREAFEHEDQVPDIVRRGTLDKIGIAVEAHKNMKSLAEMGNPHVPEGFLIKHAAPDPRRQASLAERTAQFARVVRERDSMSASEAYGSLHAGHPTPARAPVAPPAAARSVSESSGPSHTTWWALALLGASLVALVGARRMAAARAERQRGY